MGSTTSYAALPYPALADSPNVPADVQALASRLDTILSLAIGGGSTIPGTALNLSQVPGQISTLNARPVTQQAYVARTSPPRTQTTNEAQQEHTVQTLTIPAQSYLRMMLVYATSEWEFISSTGDYLSSRLVIDGTQGATTFHFGKTAALHLFALRTVAANASCALTQTIEADQTTASQQTASLEGDAVMYALMIPWFGSAFAG